MHPVWLLVHNLWPVSQPDLADVLAQRNGRVTGQRTLGEETLEMVEVSREKGSWVSGGHGGKKYSWPLAVKEAVASVLEERARLRWSGTQMREICYSSPLNGRPIRRDKTSETLFSEKQASLSTGDVRKSVGSEMRLNLSTDWHSEHEKLKRQTCYCPFDLSLMVLFHPKQ